MSPNIALLTGSLTETPILHFELGIVGLSLSPLTGYQSYHMQSLPIVIGLVPHFLGVLSRFSLNVERLHNQLLKFFMKYHSLVCCTPLWGLGYCSLSSFIWAKCFVKVMYSVKVKLHDWPIEILNFCYSQLFVNFCLKHLFFQASDHHIRISWFFLLILITKPHLNH